MVWRIDDPQGNETGKIRWETVRYTRGQGLDLGCGPNKIWPHAIGVDNYKATQQFGVEMKPDVACDCTKLSIFGSASVSWVFSSHLLEHIDPSKVMETLREWWRVIKAGGHLLLYLPHEDLYPKVGEEGANPDHQQNLNENMVIEWMKEVGSWDLLRCEKRDQDMEYSFFMVFKKFA